MYSRPLSNRIAGAGRPSGPRCSVSWNGYVRLALTLLLVGGLIVPAAPPAAEARPAEPRAHPQLLRLAAERPNDSLRVIIQREVKNRNLPGDSAEQEVSRKGGRVRQQLNLIESFSAELTGKEIEKLARHPKVRWITLDAPLVSTNAGLASVRDNFPTVAYNGDSGTNNWAAPWQETGDNSIPESGYIRVVSDSRCAGGGGFCLRFDPYQTTGLSVARAASLGGAVYASLSLYRNNQLNLNTGLTDQVVLEISANGGQSWATLRTYSSLEFLGAATDTFDITAFASSSTQVRFRAGQWQSGARFLFVDDVRIEYALPSPFLAAVRTDQLRQEMPQLTGQGIGVAVLDSGIADHADLQTGGGTRLVAAVQFGNHATASDLNGHGTHVAGIIGGGGTVHAGVAPGVNLINIRVSSDQGLSYTSDLVNAMQWIHDNRAAYNIRVVNISLNSTVPESYHTSPLSAAAEILWLNGIVVVVAAGNNGTGSGPVAINPPANDPFVITVGATEDKGTPGLSDDGLAAFSAYGPTVDGFAKPDLVAPGRNIVSLSAGAFALLPLAHPAHRVGSAYFRMSGTSMSAPVVSGAAALLLQDEPNLTPDQVKYRLMATANSSWPGFNPAQAGAGYLDTYAAVYGTTTESANAGLAVSQMLTSGNDPVGSTVNWNSVNWNSVNWNSVNWNSVNWNSVNWNSGLWDD